MYGCMPFSMPRVTISSDVIVYINLILACRLNMFSKAKITHKELLVIVSSNSFNNGIRLDYLRDMIWLVFNLFCSFAAIVM